MKAEGHAWDSDEMKALAPKRRVLYNVIDHAEPDKGIKIFEVAHFSFENKLVDEAWEEDEDGKKTDAMIIFADLEDGKTVSFKGREREFNGRTSISEFDSFVFLDRKKPYSEKMLSKAHPLDTLLIAKTYKELQDLWLGTPDEDEDDADVPFPGKMPSAAVEDEDDEPVSRPRLPRNARTATVLARTSTSTRPATTVRLNSARPARKQVPDPVGAGLEEGVALCHTIHCWYAYGRPQGLTPPKV
jgi:hypothetical protein